MAPGGNAGSGGVPTSRRSFVTGLGAAGAVLPALGLLPKRGFAEDLPQAYAGAAIFSRGFKGLDPMAPAAGSLISGAAILIPVSVLVDRPWTLSPSMPSLLALLGLSVISTAFAFVIYFRLIQTLGSVGTTAQAYLRVPIGVALGVVFLGETLSPTAWIGLGCVVIGVAAMTMPARTAAAASEVV